MKKLLLSALMLVGSLASFGQVFSGTVADTTNEPMLMASVAFLNPEDSTVASFVITDNDGYFQSGRLSEGKYFVQVSFLGYETYSKEVTVGENGTPSDLGIIKIKPALNTLSEVVINGQRIPVLINKDTVEYNASSFRVQADDNVEDLLKRLPGIEVERDGSITAQGQEVQQVLVDGKEFFGGDPTVATRNIPADAVERVQVYDRQTDDAMFTGVDDGERSKTINLELKEDRKNGYFGYAEGGGGYADDRFPFIGKGGLHSFTNTTRLSVLTNVNNINDYGFSFGDMRDMSGSSGGMGRGGYMITVNDNNGIPMNYSGPNDGLYFSGATGVNLNWDPNSKHRFNASYFYSHLDNFTTTTENSQEFFGDTEIIGFRESEENSVSNNHSFNINHRSDLDTMNRIEFKANGNYQVGFSNSSIFEERDIERQGTLQQSSRNTNSQNTNTGANFNLNYIHKFNNAGRLLTIRTSLNTSDRESQGEWQNNNAFPLDNDVDSLFQSRGDLSNNRVLSASAAYSEPIAKNHLLEFTARLSSNEENLTRTTIDVYSGGFLEEFSPIFNMSENTRGIAMAYKYTGQEHNLDVSLRGNAYTQGAIESRFESTIENRTYMYLLPSVNYNWSLSSFSRLSFNYGTDVQLPELTQLLTLRDITNPLITYVGNANLEPQFNQSVWAHYGTWNSFSGYGVWGFISAGRTDNVISTSQTIDNQYVRTFTPENFDTPAYNVRGNVSYNQSINAIGMRTRVGANSSWSSSPSRINGDLNEQTNTSAGGSLSVSNLNQDILEVSVGGSWNMNWSTFSLQERLNQEYLSQSYFVDFEWNVTKALGVESGVEMNNYSNASFAEDQFVPVWNANISYNLSKTGTAQLELTVFDILNQNRGINRFGNLNAIIERNTNSLGRYVMISFLYKFNSNMGGASGEGSGRREEIRVTH